MNTYDDSDAFEEDAITFEEAMGACDRFVAFRSGEGLAFRLWTDEDQGVRLISKDEVMHFLDARLETGATVKA